MGIYDFNILSDHYKYDIAFTKGKFVDTVTKGKIKYALYAVSMFWVEVTYNAKDNKIKGIKSFVGGETLDKYSNVPKEI
jgi:hypothetical protein